MTDNKEEQNNNDEVVDDYEGKHPPFKKHPETSPKVGGLIINDKDASNTKLVIEIIKNLAKKIIKFEIIDMLKFSRPAKITSPISLHQCVAKEYIQTSLLIKAWENNNDPIERMKYLAAFSISGIHTSPEYCKSKAPFNPIIGETFQATRSDGCKIYMEQTVHHPPTFNFLLEGPEKKFSLMGFGTIEANLDGLNVIRGCRKGKNIYKFDDGSMIYSGNFATRINGVIMGDRTYNYYGNLTLKDYKNKIECVCTMVDEPKEGIINKLFKKRKAAQYDEIKIEIRQLNPETKVKELKAVGYASWVGQVYFGDKCYWSIFDEKEEWTQEGLSLLPSDSIYREDLQSVLKGDMNNAQVNKEKLEELQRQDQKKRDAFAKKK